MTPWYSWSKIISGPSAKELEFKLLPGRGLHPELRTSHTGDTRFCAFGRCRGECGLPALLLRAYYDMSSGVELEDALAKGAPKDDFGVHYVDLKACGPYVASGPVWQACGSWSGEKIFLPETLRTDSIRRLYWT